MKPVVDFTNILRADFTHADPKSVKKNDNLTVFFALSGSECVKAAHIMLMKLKPMVYFTNILQAAFTVVDPKSAKRYI